MNGRPYGSIAILLALGCLSAASFAGLGQGQSSSSQPVRMIGVDDAGAGYWPRWRGASGQGLAVDSGYPDAWSDKENVLWRTPVPGRGHSSPIVWGDRIFVTTAYTDGRASVVAFRRSAGGQSRGSLPAGKCSTRA